MALTRIKENYSLADGKLKAALNCDKESGEVLDSDCDIKIQVVVEGASRKEFLAKLESLVLEYQI